MTVRSHLYLKSDIRQNRGRWNAKSYTIILALIMIMHGVVEHARDG